MNWIFLLSNFIQRFWFLCPIHDIPDFNSLKSATAPDLYFSYFSFFQFGANSIKCLFCQGEHFTMLSQKCQCTNLHMGKSSGPQHRKELNRHTSFKIHVLTPKLLFFLVTLLAIYKFWSWIKSPIWKIQNLRHNS